MYYVLASDDAKLWIRGYGDLYITFDGTHEVVRFHRIAHAPELDKNLTSIGKLDTAGRSFTIGQGMLIMYNSDLALPKKNGAYVGRAMRVNPRKEDNMNPNPAVIDINRFNRSYSHTSKPILWKRAEKLNLILTGPISPCSGCLTAKGLKRPVQQSTEIRAKGRLTRVFVDLTGRKQTMARDGSYHTIMIVKKDYSRRTWLYFLKHKNETHIAFKKFLRVVKGDGVVKYVRSDNCQEFMGPFADLCLENENNKLEYTSPGTHQQNGVAEWGLTQKDVTQQTVSYHAREVFSHEFVELPK